MNIGDIVIDKEFKSALRELTQEEHLQLKKNIEQDLRLTDPFHVWKETGILLDGHHRIEIYRNHYESDPDFEKPGVVLHRFKGREQALRWVRNHQAGRRNQLWEEIQIGREYEGTKAHPTKGHGNQHTKQSGGAKKGTGKKTAAKVGEKHGKTEKQVRSAGKLARDYEKIKENHGADVANQIIKANPSKAAVARVASGKETPDHILNPRKPPKSTPVKGSRRDDHLAFVKKFVNGVNSWVKKANNHCRSMKLTDEEQSIWNKERERLFSVLNELEKSWRI